MWIRISAFCRHVQMQRSGRCSDVLCLGTPQAVDSADLSLKPLPQQLRVGEGVRVVLEVAPRRGLAGAGARAEGRSCLGGEKRELQKERRTTREKCPTRRKTLCPSRFAGLQQPFNSETLVGHLHQLLGQKNTNI